MTRKHVYAACLVFVVLTVAVIGLGYRAKKDVETVALDQFNRQQLLLAQKIAEDIAGHFAFLRACLVNFGPLLRAQNTPPDAQACPATPTFSDMLAPWQVVSLGLLHPGQEAPTFFDAKGKEMPAAGLFPPLLQKILKTGHPNGHILISRVFSPKSGPLAGHRLVAMVRPLVGGGDILLLVDAEAVSARYAHNVRSGKTGYAWVVDASGVFLDHVEASFVGHDSLQVRRQRNPAINWTPLASLMQSRILTGQTGVGWYLSGWHRNRLGEVRKLVAFCPVILDRASPDNRWAVAVTAPVDEVEGLIGRLLLREWFLMGVIELIVFIGFMLTLHIALRWSRELARQVDIKTKDLLSTQRELLRSQRFAAIGEAAARLSHEIKNPLMLMGGFASQVRRHLPKDGSDFSKLGIVESEAKRLESLLNDVRDFTRPAPPQIVPGDINATVEDSVALLADTLKARSIRIDFTPDRTLPPVPHDPARIKQVLLNLLKNAMEAMESGGTITVATARTATGVAVSVTDTGGGIPEAVRDRLFDPFCTTKESGTGLGLTVCQRIMTDHHGSIRHAPTADGTVFTVELPVEPNEEKDEAMPPAAGRE